MPCTDPYSKLSQKPYLGRGLQVPLDVEGLPAAVQLRQLAHLLLLLLLMFLCCLGARPQQLPPVRARLPGGPGQGEGQYSAGDGIIIQHKASQRPWLESYCLHAKQTLGEIRG